MKNIKRIALSLAALLLICGAFMAVPVYAHEDDMHDDNTGERTEDRSGSSVPDHDEMDDSKRSSQLAEQFHKQGDDRIKTLRAQNKQRSQADRQKSCLNRKEALNKRMNQKVAHAQRHKAFFDKVYSKVKDFHDSNQLNIPNYDTLIANVDSAQTSAQDNIDALKALDVDIDCTSQTIGDSVSSFQQAVKATRDALKDYRMSLHELIKAIHQSADDDKSDDNSSEEQ